MKIVLIIPVLVLSAAVIGFAVCHAAAWTPHVRELSVSAVVCMIAGLVALVPAFLARSAGVAAVSQSGLFGTIIHMFLAILLSAIASLAKLITQQKPYLFWLLAFYWISLVAVVTGLAIIVRQVARDAAEKNSAVQPTNPRPTPKPS